MAKGNIITNAGPREAQNLKRLYADNDIVRTSRLEQLRTGRWAVVYNVREGKGWRRTPKSLGTQDRATAERRYIDFLKDAVALASGALSAPAKPTVGDVLEYYITNRRMSWDRRNSQPIFANLLKQDLGHLTIDELTPPVINAYRMQNGHLADPSMRRRLSVLIAAMNYSKKHSMIDVKPVIDLPPENPPRDAKLTKAQEAFFWDKAQRWPDNHAHPKDARRVALFVAIALDTGARMGAIMDLTWDRVDFSRGQIQFQPPGRVPTKKRRPLVPIAPRLLPVLRAAHAEAGGYGPVFQQMSIKEGFRSFARSVGMPWVTPHVLRHTWATLAADRGVPPPKVALMLGDTVATVMKYYVNLTADDLVGVV